jgi:eukaryotic-like serine/threonine-protein kinase
LDGLDSTLSSLPATSSAIIPKKVFGYDVIEKLGEGAGSTIYAVSDPSSGQLYALKHVIRNNEKDIRHVEQLENEFNVSRLFRHPALRKYHDLKISKSLFRRVTEAALVMELVDGVPLDKQKPKDLPTILDIFTQTAVALAALHYLLYVHCDLKPSNILTQADGKVKLIDFGQACKSGTVKERIQGTPDFIAPEQVKLKPVTVQTDVYNFGATLYWALAGQRVPTLYTVKKAERDVVIEGKFPSPRERNPDVPKEVSDLVMQCVRVEIGRRPRDMNEILQRLGWKG